MLLYGQLYLSEIEFLMLIFSLVLEVIQPSLSTPPRLFLGSQLGPQLLFLLLQGSQGLLSLGMGVGLSPSLITSVPGPFLNYKDLLGNLHKNNKRILCNKEKEEGTLAFN